MQIIIKNQQKTIPVSKRTVKTTALKTLKLLKRNIGGDLTVVFVNNKIIQRLNSKFLAKAYPTDVLSFDLREENRFLADIVISAEKALENSRIYKTTPQHEMKLYLIHGILHLFGYRDYRKKDRLRMERKANQILRQIQ